MENPVSRQLLQALAAFCLGLVSGVFYDLLRVLRAAVRKGLFTVLCDLVFSAVYCLALFLLGFTIGRGRVRVFLTVFSALSSLLYFYTVSPYIRKTMQFFFNGIFRFMEFLTRPVRFVTKKIRFFQKKLFSYVKK